MLLQTTAWYNSFIGLKPSDVICESVLHAFILKEFALPHSECLKKLIVSKAKLISDICVGKCLSRLIQFYHYDLNKLTATEDGAILSFRKLADRLVYSFWRYLLSPLLAQLIYSVTDCNNKGLVVSSEAAHYLCSQVFLLWNTPLCDHGTIILQWIPN